MSRTLQTIAGGGVGLLLSAAAVAALAQTVTLPPAATSTGAVDDIRDIRGPIPVPQSWPWMMIAGALLLLTIAAAALWYWKRRQKKVAARPVYEIALENLERSRSLMGADTAREYSIAASEIVRSFIEQRFQILAARRTTEEFLHELMQPSGALLKGQRVLLGSFLNHCDRAKFSRWVPSSAEMEDMHQSARAFVLDAGEPPQIDEKPVKRRSKKTTIGKAAATP